jgi:hypothetical protein
MSEEEKTQLPGWLLADMTPAQIVQARKEGRLNDLLAGNDPGVEPEPFTPPNPDPADQGARGPTFRSPREWVASLTPDAIVRLRKSGHLDFLLRGEDGTQ